MYEYRHGDCLMVLQQYVLEKLQRRNSGNSFFYEPRKLFNLHPVSAAVSGEFGFLDLARYS